MEFKSRHELTDDWHGDGVLMTWSGYRSIEGQRLLEKLKQRNTPVVLLEENNPDSPYPGVSGNDVAIGRLAARHFNERKFHHAAFFSAYNEPSCQNARLEGFQKAWKGLSLQTWLWAREVPETDLENWEKLLKWLVAKLRKAPKPLAVFAWNDYDAGRFMNACLQAELKIPDDVAILGVDNYLDICEHTPVKLSSIKHDLARIGHVGAAMLQRLMSGGALSRQHIRVKPQGIVTRESTDPLAVFAEELRPVIAYIDANLSHAFGAAEIASALKIPRSRLDYLFKIEFGHSVGLEIATRRIALAKKLLRHTKHPIEEVSKECGYCNRSFFSKCFQRATGTTPLAWRKNHL